MLEVKDVTFSYAGSSMAQNLSLTLPLGAVTLLLCLAVLGQVNPLY